MLTAPRGARSKRVGEIEFRLGVEDEVGVARVFEHRARIHPAGLRPRQRNDRQRRLHCSAGHEDLRSTHVQVW
jgi:hypothetical protein